MKNPEEFKQYHRGYELGHSECPFCKELEERIKKLEEDIERLNHIISSTISDFSNIHALLIHLEKPEGRKG